MAGVQNIMAYHHSGTCGYLLIRRAWMSGCSLMERLDCTQICLRKYRNVCMSVDVIDANDRPYVSAKVVERKSGLYASYFSMLRVASSLMILDTS